MMVHYVAAMSLPEKLLIKLKQIVDAFKIADIELIFKLILSTV